MYLGNKNEVCRYMYIYTMQGFCPYLPDESINDPLRASTRTAYILFGLPMQTLAELITSRTPTISESVESFPASNVHCSTGRVVPHTDGVHVRLLSTRKVYTKRR